MKANKASQTAVNAASARAYHFSWYGEPKVFRDPFAIHFLDPAQRFTARNRIVYWLICRKHLYGWAEPAWNEVVARARFTEDHLEESVEAGANQYVILGAGLDTFVFRNPEFAARLTIYEVDHPATLELKRTRAATAGLRFPENFVQVPIDFNLQTLGTVLEQSAFASDVPSFFSWLGTTYFLDEGAITSTLETIAAQAAAGSCVAFDYLDARLFDEGPGTYTMKRLFRNVASYGEPFLSGFHKDEMTDLLTRLGYEIQDHVDYDAINARYFAGRTDGVLCMEGSHFVCARVR